MTIFVGQGMTKSRYLKIFKSKCLVEFLRYCPNFFAFFGNIRSHSAPCLISQGGILSCSAAAPLPEVLVENHVFSHFGLE